jgi:hypothetical protein
MSNSSLSTSLNLPIDRVLLGTTALWDAEAKWHDRDGLPIPPTPKLVLRTFTILRRWLDNEHIDITEYPLPDVGELNATIKKPWRTGLNGQEEPPFSKYYVVWFCDPQTGALYTYLNKTYGAKLAYEQLEEQIAVVRTLRGANVVPVVHLDERPMKTKKYGMKSRPHFHVIDWKVPANPNGTGDAQLPSQSSTQQLGGPTGAAAPAPPPAPSAAPTSASPPPTPEVKAASTLDQMKSAKPVTLGEIISDELPPYA